MKTTNSVAKNYGTGFEMFIFGIGDKSTGVARRPMLMRFHYTFGDEFDGNAGGVAGIRVALPHGRERQHTRVLPISIHMGSTVGACLIQVSNVCYGVSTPIHRQLRS